MKNNNTNNINMPNQANKIIEQKNYKFIEKLNTTEIKNNPIEENIMAKNPKVQSNTKILMNTISSAK